MKYLCLICAEAVMEQTSESDTGRSNRGMAESCRRSGEYIACNRLLPLATMTTYGNLREDQ